MDESTISALLDSQEGSSLEFKKSLEFPEAVARTICAFANSFGGYIVIGAERLADRLAASGVPNSDAAFQKFAGIVAQLQPKPYYTTQEYKRDGKTLILIRVDALPISDVCFLKKSVFRRVGSINEEVSGPNLARFLQQRGTLSFEENRSEAKICDLSREKILHLIEKKGVDAKKHEPLSIKSLLVSMGVANSVGEFYLKNAAVLFFAEDVRKFFMNPEIRLVKYRGTEKSLDALENDQRFADTLPELLETAFKETKKNAGTFGRIVDGKRVDAPMVPDEVLREALTNAVGHRDYFDPNGILVELFDDRMEITNPGSLLPGQTIRNFAETRKHRNPIAYKLLNDSKWGEGLNLGITAMYRDMRRNKLPDPEFKDLGGMFKITLYGPLSKRKPRAQGARAARQGKALEYLKTHDSITAPQYAKLAGISHPTAITDLNNLATQEILAKTGAYRSSQYHLQKH